MQANNIIFTDQCPELVKNYLIELIVKRNRKIKISQICQQEIQEQIENLQNQGEKSQISDFNIKFQGKSQLEIQKQLEFYQKNLNFQVFLINKGGDLLKADFLGGNCENKFLELLQFFDPPQVIKAENEGVRFLDKIQFLRENKRLVFTFIPEKHVYNSDYRRAVESEFDSFGKQFNNLDVEELEERFRKAKYLDVSSNCEYFLIRNAQLAEVLGVGKDEIGEIYHLKVGNKFNNFDTSVKYFQKDICLSKIEKDVNDERDQQVKGKQLPLQIVNEKILNKNLEYINFVQEESEMVNQLRISQKLGNSKFLVYYQTQELEEEYERKLFRKLINFKKKIGQIDKNLKDIQIIYSNNSDLVQKYFGICVPDRFSSDFYKDTVRFIDSEKKVNLGEINENQKLKNLQVISLDEEDKYIQNDKYQKEQNGQKKEKEKEKNINININQAGNLLFCSEDYYLENKHQFYRQSLDKKTTVNNLVKFVSGQEKNNYDEKLSQNQNVNENQNQRQVYLESNYPDQQIYEYSLPLNSNYFNKLILENQENDSLIYFFKPGCSNCYTAQQGVEEFSKIMEEITFKLKNYELKKEEYKEFDMENVINKLRIYNKEVLKDVKVYRYNVYNECIQFPSPSATPLFILVPKNSVQLGIQPIIFDLQKDRVNFNQKDQVVKYLVRRLEDSLFQLKNQKNQKK